MATPRFPVVRCARAGRVTLATLFVVLLGCLSSASSAQAAQTIVSLTFDDGIATQLRSATKLESKGLRGTFYINSAKIGNGDPYFMDWTQLTALSTAGHEIGGHTLDHRRLTTLTPTEQRIEICDDVAALRSHGFAVNNFAYPFGAGSTQPAVLAALQECGFTSARKVGELRDSASCPTCPFAETLPPTKPYGVRSAPVPTGSITLASLQQQVMQAEQNGGGWVPFVFHDVCNGCGESSVSAAVFNSFVDWVAKRVPSGTVVKTVRQALAEGPQFPPPSTAIACNNGACGTASFKSPVSISFTRADGGGGLGATRYTLDGTDPLPSSPEYTGPFTLTQTTTVKFRTWDLTGNAESVRAQVVNVDGTAPTVSVSSPASGSRVLTSGDPVNVSIAAADTGSGVADVQLLLDGDWLGSSTSTSSPYQFTLPATLALGNHRLKAIATDRAGNQTTSAQSTFTLSDGTPITSIACNGAACPTAFVKGPLSVSLSAADGGTGVGTTRYTLDGTDPTTSSTEYTGPFTLTESKTVKFRTWSSSGQPEPVKSQLLKIDAVAPTAAITTPANGSNVQGDVTIEVNAADAGSGLRDAELLLDGDWKAYTAAKPFKFTLPRSELSLGAHRIKVIVFDNLGNRTDTAQVNFTLKDGLPETSIACNGAACPTDWVKGPLTVSLSATDGGGGLGATRYTLDGSDPTPSSPQYTSPFTLTESATVKYRTWDSTGAAETVKTKALKIDAVAPTASIIAPLNGSNVQGDVTITVNAADAGAGIRDAELFLDGDWKAYTGTAPYQFVLPAAELGLGAHRVRVMVFDKLGNRTTTDQVNFTLKDGLPETAIACNGAACSNAWQKGPVSVALSAADGGGGLAATRYTLDGSDPTPSSPQYTAPFTLTSSATVKYRTWDLAGRPEPVKTQQLQIDAVAPTAAITSPANGSIQLGDVTIDVDAADAGSGLRDAELFVDGDWKAYTAAKPFKFTLPKSELGLGAHRIKVIVFDNLGNRVDTAQVNFSLKDGLPETAIACNGAACSADWQKGPVQVSLSATNSGGGGLGATRYTLDGTDPTESSTEYTGPFTLSESATVKYRTWDTTGVAETVKSTTLKVDGVAPVAQINSPAQGANVVGDVLVSADVSDAGVGLAGVELFLDGDFTAVSSATSSPYEFTIAAGTIPLGTHRVKIIATDKLGNRTSTDNVTFALTNGLPTTTIACDGTACSPNWQKGPVLVSLAATESGNGVGATRYTLDGSDPDTSSTEYTGPFTLTETTTVKFRSWDSDGNAEQVRAQEIKLDAVVPTVAITSPNEGTDRVGDVTVEVDAVDTGVGIADVQLFLDGDYYAAKTTAPYSFALPSSLAFGAHRVKAIATDKLGSTASTATVNFTLKDGVPTTSIQCNGAACPAGFVKDPVSVTLSATDGGSGVGATRYTLDGTDPTESSTLYTSPFTVSETTTVKFRTWNSTGGTEPVREQTIKIDATAPTAQITAPDEGTNVVGDVTVSVDATDAGVGLDEVELFLDGDFAAIASAASSPIQFTLAAGTIPLGAHRVKVFATDKLGNRTSTPYVNFTLTNGLPTTTIACDGGPCSANWQKGPVQVSLAATESGNGVGATRYTLDGSDPDTSSTEYTGPFSLTETTTVKFRSYDADGNAEQVRSQEIKLDAGAPTVAITSPASGSDQVGTVEVQVDAADAGSGIADVQLFLDGDYLATDASAPYSFTLPASLSFGAHRVKAIATDKLGNAAGTANVNFTLKDGVPLTTIACDGSSCPAGFGKDPVSVTLAAIDGGSGVGATRYTLDGTDPTESSTEYTGPFTVSETTTVKFRSWSTAGDVEPVRSQTIKIDTTAPTAALTSPVEGAEVEGDVAVTVDASDAGVGVGEVHIFLDGDYVTTLTGPSSPYTYTWHTDEFLPGAHRVKAIVADKLGHQTPTATVNVTIKSPPPPPGPPTTTIACDGVGCPDGFVKSPVSVTLAALDGGLGVGATRYTLNGSDPSESSTEYTGPFTLTETTTVKFRSWSPSGEVEEVRSQTIKVDSTAPTAVIVSPSEGEEITDDLVVMADASDVGAGVASLDLYVDGDFLGTFNPMDGSYEITVPAGTLAPGAHRIEIEATDKVGNTFGTEQVGITVAG